jgi:hypothetical protein
MNEVASVSSRREFAFLSPADLAHSRKHIGNRLLASVMVHSGARAWLDFEKAAPQGGRNANFPCNCSGASRAPRLGRPEIELIGTDYSDRVAGAHAVAPSSLKRPHDLAEP